MKNILFPLALTAVITCTALSSCSKDSASKSHTKTYTYTIYKPVYKSKKLMLAGINASPGTAITHAGKMYVNGNFIYINDVDKGIHVFDNTDKKNPKQTAYLAIPGNKDIAVKGNVLYADMYSDLLTIDVSDIHNVKIANSVFNFFPYNSFNGYYYASTPDSIAVAWIAKDTTVTYTYYDCDSCDFIVPQVFTNKSSGNVPGSSGVAGSMASMVVVNNYLYAITEPHSLGIVDISKPLSPVVDSSLFAGLDLETIYPFKDKLFIGSAEGVFMYDISNPELPVQTCVFTHGTACDPVIADGNYAYVTLHTGTNCGGDSNELDVVDVTDMSASLLVKSYGLTKPTGLSKDGNYLFVCDSTNVKVFNAQQPADLKLLQKIESRSPYDVIASNNDLIVVTATGLYQYDYSDISNIKPLSFIDAKQ